MYRVAASRLKPIKGHVRDRFSSLSAVTQRASSSRSIFSWFTGNSSNSSPPLDFPLKGVTLPPPLPDYVEPAKTKITTLPNGVKIASETSTNPAASIGLYVDCGSVYETPISNGASHLLERMAFKSTTNRSHLRLVREVEAIGGNVTASASREQMGYTYDALKTYVPEMVELLVDSVRNPVFLDWEVNEQIQKVKAEISEINNNPQGLLMEALHSAGYSGALANPLLAPESSIDRLNSTILEEFVAENFTAPRMVLAASGVEHEELLSVAKPLLSDLPAVPHSAVPKSQYVGGDFRCQAASPGTHVALAFEVPGGWHKETDAMIVTVLQMLMGGGGSFSAGGPGKGMYSRLYLRILNEYHQIQSFSAFSSIYNDTGLFGIHATTGSDFVSKAVDLAARELLLVATPGKVTQGELDRAKESTKSAVLMNMESRMVVSEDIGRQILTYGERKPVEYFLKAVDEVTLNDISSLASKIVSSPLTMASWGDATTLSAACFKQTEGGSVAKLVLFVGREKLSLILLVAVLATCHASSHGGAPLPIHLLRPQSSSGGHLIDGISCDSWRLAVETNNIRNWNTVPAQCGNYVGHYMLSAASIVKTQKLLPKRRQNMPRPLLSRETTRRRGSSTSTRLLCLVDIDETTLSNIPYYHGFGIETYNATSFEWVDSGKAPVLLESLKLYKKLISSGFKVVFLTGRVEKRRQITVKNLNAAGYRNWEKLLLRGPSDSGKAAVEYKSEQRAKLEQDGYRIVGNIGDQWSDILGTNTGSRTFKLPDPMYYIG
ncbi:Acid phosphatase (Class B) [Macleaya cordata]|uniref:Acid phosphatase (Class B) n=1 Tax=Macleaya cordata TaxID=56857 RepID=A0A200QPQ7_MACCD|nr:Acid phosphatase (Class B) [Macleaya cordata]